jgi:altronate dehydratase large subunit
MTERTFLGYVRENGRVGIRNHVLILSVTHASHLLAAKIAVNVNGVKVFVPEDEDGRSTRDRQTISRTMIGLGANPNVHSVLLLANSENVAYEELALSYIQAEIQKTGKPVEKLVIKDAGGTYAAIGEGIRIAKRLVLLASQARREPVPMGRLFMGVKCGLSDATSGIAGNPTVGYLSDRIIEGGGTFIFSETTEVIGAEHILAKRCANDSVRDALLSAVQETEDEARETGEDIRTINPIPANIQAGITTLEEKSLGAIIKAGSTQLMGVTAYAERPAGSGLYFMNSWMSSTSLFMGYAASGAVLSIFQLGGGALPPQPPMPALATGIVMPIMYVTGNHRTYEMAQDDVDFNAGRIISEDKGIEEIGEELCASICDVASGTIVHSEAWNYQDRVEIYLKGPAL